MDSPLSPAHPFMCSRCERPNRSADLAGPSGSCTSCATDGVALCDVCFGLHVTAHPRFRGHAYSRSDSLPTATEFLLRLGLQPRPHTCDSHGGLPLTGLECAKCTASADSGAVSAFGLCLECIQIHSAVHPTHVLTPAVKGASALRTALVSAAWEPVDGCRAAAAALAAATAAGGSGFERLLTGPPSPAESPARRPRSSGTAFGGSGGRGGAGSSATSPLHSPSRRSGSRSPPPPTGRSPGSTGSSGGGGMVGTAGRTPVAACARHKVVAVARELDALPRYAEAARAQLAAAQAAAAAALAAHFGSLADSLEAAVRSRRAALASELSASDSALNRALEAAGDAQEVRRRRGCLVQPLASSAAVPVPSSPRCPSLPALGRRCPRRRGRRRARTRAARARRCRTRRCRCHPPSARHERVALRACASRGDAPCARRSCSGHRRAVSTRRSAARALASLRARGGGGGGGDSWRHTAAAACRACRRSARRDCEQPEPEGCCGVASICTACCLCRGCPRCCCFAWVRWGLYCCRRRYSAASCRCGGRRECPARCAGGRGASRLDLRECV